MKFKIAFVALSMFALTACKKDYTCECTSVFYTDGAYAGSQDDIKQTVSSASECTALQMNTDTEVKTCSLED